MSSLRYFIYLRKSSESEERQELSIPGQARELNELAQKRSLNVVAPPFEESQSARTPGRPLFNAMLKRLYRGEADAILCWKLDRLARNLVDGGQVICDMGQGVIKGVMTSERFYSDSPDDKFMMGVLFAQAAKYVDDLSKVVRRGNYDTLAEGRWPGKPKIGYRRDHDTKLLVRDEERFVIIEQLWQLLLTGTPPLEILRIANSEYGLRTPRYGKHGDKPVCKAWIYRLFRDPFYTGIMVRGGVSYLGKHPAMITREEFEQAQAILDGNVRPLAKPQHLSFIYGGLIFCGRCGAAVTAKHCTNRHGTRYTYYYCCRKERRYQYCPERAVQEKYLDQEFQRYFDAVRLPPRYEEALLKHLGKKEHRTQAQEARIRQNVEQLLNKNERELENLRKLLRRDTISEEDYLKDKDGLLIEQQKLREALEKAQYQEQLVEPHQGAIKQLNEAGNLFRQAPDAEKRELIKIVTWNLNLQDRKLVIGAKKPFSYLGEWSRFVSVWAWMDYVGTQIHRPETKFIGYPQLLN